MNSIYKNVSLFCCYSLLCSLFLLTNIEQSFASKKQSIQGIMNINTATQEQLTLLPRIGAKMARRIIKFREKKKFTKPTDLMKVRGIGEKTFKKIQQLITTTKETKFTLKP